MICIIKGAIIGPLCLYVSQGKVDLEKTTSLKIHIRVRLSIAFSFTVFKRKILENVETSTSSLRVVFSNWILKKYIW